MENDLIEKLLTVAHDVGKGKIPEYQHYECYTSGAFDTLLLRKRGAEAFQTLETLCSRYEQIKNDASFLRGYLILLGAVAPLTETTELPKGMRIILLENADSSPDLKRWYRF